MFVFPKHLQIFVTIFCCTSLFFKALASEAPEPSGQNLVQKTLQQVYEDDPSCLLNLCSQVVEEKQGSAQENLEAFEAAPSWKEKAAFYPMLKEVLEALPRLRNIKGPQKTILMRQLETWKAHAQKFLEADALAWLILKNSLGPNLGADQVSTLLAEALRFSVTTGGDLSRNEQSTAKAFLWTRWYNCKIVLACLLTQLELQSGSPVESSGDEVIQVCLKSEPNPHWYLWMCLAFFAKSLKQQDATFEIEEGDLQKLLEMQTSSFTLAPEVSQRLSKTSLFQILDGERRQQTYQLFNQLHEYTVWDGFIEEFVKSRQQDAEQSLSSTRKKTPHKKKRKQKKRSQTARISQDKETDPLQDTSYVPLSSEEELQSPSSLNTPSVKEPQDFSEEGWTLVGYSAKQSKKPAQRAFLYWDYWLKRNIGVYIHLNYQCAGQEYSTADLFRAILVTQQDSEKYIRFVAQQRGHQNLRLANLAKFFLVFHINQRGERKTATFVDQDVYMSGAQLFTGEKEVEFKEKNHIKIAFNDLLAPAQQQEYWKTHELRGLYVNWMVQDQIFNKIAGGRWVYNALHSEAGLSLDLIDHKLSGYLHKLATQYADCDIEAITLGISSLYDCCFHCRNLLQGLQWRLQGILHTIVDGPSLPLSVNPNLKTLVVVQGQLRDAHAFDPEALKMVRDYADSGPFLDLEAREDNQHHKFAFQRLKD